MSEHDPFELLEQLDEERSTNRRRETFLVSVIIHMMLVLLIVTQPDLFKKLMQKDTVPVRPRDVTMLYEPNLPKVKTPPKTSVLSDANRKAQPGNNAPQLKYVPPPTPVPVAPQQAPAGPKPDAGKSIAKQSPPSVGIPDFPEPPKVPPKQRPTFEQVRPEPNPSQAQLDLPALAPPSRGTDAILRDMAKANASGGGQGIGGGGGGYGDGGPRNPKLNIPGPQIISDTMGVDFNPYLMRILSLVRRNWYSVIPEIARIGRQGRVELQFTILRNGNVPELVLTGGSGTESMDTAALSSIRMSSPFPPLPPEFPGQDIKLRFIYLYNMPVE